MTIRVTGLDGDTLDLFNALVDNLDRKQKRNLIRASYYDGRRAIRSVSPVMPPQYQRLGMTLGWTAKGVDLLARRCNLEGFVWPDGNLDDLGYREVWDGNMMSSEVDQGLLASLIYGPAFVVNTLGGDGEPPALVHFKSGTDATGVWDSRARRLSSLLSVTARGDDGAATEYALYLDGSTATIVDGDNGWEVADWPEHPWGVPAEKLVYKPRLDRPFGSSRITRAGMALQDEGVRTIIRGMGHMDVYSWPEFWMLGADERIFKNADGSPKASWQVMLGRVKGIPDDDEAENPRADVKHFPAQSPQPHQAWLNTMAKSFAREMSLPDTALALTDFANPTGAESYDASQYELIAEAEGATDEWSAPLRRSWMRSLAMANGEDKVPDSWASMDSQWRDPRYLSRSAQADAGTKQLAAAPWLSESEVGLELLGLTSQQIRRALADRRRVQGRQVLDTLRQVAAGGNVAADAPSNATD